MKPLTKKREHSEKLRLFAMLAGIFFTLVGLNDTAFAISGKELEYEAIYLISSILTDRIEVLLLILIGVVSILAFLPATKHSEGYLANLKTAAILTVFVSFTFGILKSIAFVVSNKYVQYKMYYLIFYSISSILTDYILTALFVLIVIFLALAIVNGLLNVLGANKKVKSIICSGLVPALLMFIIGGYWLNKTYLPEFSGLKSIIGNAIWAFICLVIGCVLGWAIHKIPKLNLYVSKLNSFKISAAILVLVILLNLFNFFYQPSMKADRPNIILISIDTLRADHLGSYGYDRNTTPNIDLLAKDGVLFLNTIAQAPWTLPSHISLFTGLYSSSHGVIETTNKLSDEHLTLPEILKNSGYETVAFTDGGYVSHVYGYQGFDIFDDAGNGYSTTAVENSYSKAVNWLKKRHSRPFFLFLHIYQVHCPYDPPPQYDIYSDKNYRGIVQVSGNCARYYKSIKPKMTHNDYLYVIDKYDGEIYYTDHFLGKLFNELKDLEIYDNSIIIVTSDHGENFLDHPLYPIAHNELYDAVVKVPLIIKAPMFPKNQIIDAQVESIDIMPTVTELLGIHISNKVDGMSLVELVKRGSYDKIFAFSENLKKIYNYEMIRSADWKLLQRTKKQLELFDLNNDPDEGRNLLREKPEVAKSLYEELNAWIVTQEEKSKEFTVDRIQLDNELKEKLKALGYVN